MKTKPLIRSKRRGRWDLPAATAVTASPQDGTLHKPVFLLLSMEYKSLPQLIRCTDMILNHSCRTVYSESGRLPEGDFSGNSSGGLPLSHIITLEAKRS